MPSNQNSQKPNIKHTRANFNGRQRQAIAQDMKARGLNPVTVSDLKQRHAMPDLKQRHAMPAGRERGFLSTLLRRG